MSDAALPETLQKRLGAAIKAALNAGEIQRNAYQTELKIQTKSSGIDLVTEVDHQCDALIQKILKEELADIGTGDLFLTEETYSEGSNIDLSNTWVVDPLDGTTNYTHGFPFFAVSIAFVENNHPIIGVVYDPMRDELFTTVKGYGAFLNNNLIRVSNAEHISKALLATGFPYNTGDHPADNVHYLQQILAKCQGVRRAGAAALDLVYVACGRLDGFWEMRLSPWDIAAGALIVTEAGGPVSNFDGGPLTCHQRRIDIVACNSTAVQDEIVAICKTHPKRVACS